jgi:hypothetical protein
MLLCILLAVLLYAFIPAKTAAVVACRQFTSVRAAVSALVRTVSTVEPEKTLAALCEKRYNIYRRIYPTAKPLLRLTAENRSER